MKYRTIFVSDIHLGMRYSQAEKFLDFLKHNDAEAIYFVGDIIDGWAIKRRFVWKQSHSDVIQKILRKARKGTRIVFVPGNHDEFLRPFVPLMLGERIEVVDEAEYKGLNGKRYFVTHGDYFDSVTMTKKWVAKVGDLGYEALLRLNYALNFFRRKLGFYRYWSLSKYVKESVKKSVNFITDFESVLATHAKKKGFEGIICGHIHKAEIREIDGIEYLNCGDWVESCTALVETMEGEWKIVEWHSQKEFADAKLSA